MKNSSAYYTHSRPEMLPYVPVSAKHVLDLGCGAGQFAASVKQRNSAEVWGIELDAEAADCASKQIDHVQTGNVLDLVDDLPSHHFDVVTCNDLLEHLPDPGALLTRIRSLLAPGGCLVCSIPNVRHISVLAGFMLRGEWRYTDSGPLDRTHLRFFTQRSIPALFSDAGWELNRIEGINPYADWRFALLNAMTLGRFSDCRYLQFACVAFPAGQVEP